MRKIEKVAIIGIGAIGASYLAQILAKTPAGTVRVIASGERAARYKADGVYVNDIHYMFSVCGTEEETSPADLLLISVKYNQLQQAIKEAKNQIGPETIIMSLMNGVTSEREISAVYGASHTLLSDVIKISATRKGNRTVYSPKCAIQFGCQEKNDVQLKDVALVKDFFDLCGINYEIHEDMWRTLWKKFMMNTGLNQTTAILRFPFGLLRKSEPAREIALSAMREAAAVAAHEGVSITEKDVNDTFGRIFSLPAGGKTSMLQDVEALRPTEAAMLGETVVRLGKLYGVPVPVNETLNRMIRAIEGAYLK